MLVLCQIGRTVLFALAVAGGEAGREEGTADAEGRARDCHGAERLHVAEGDHSRPRQH